MHLFQFVFRFISYSTRDRWTAGQNGHILMTLIDILHTFNLADEQLDRQKLTTFLSRILNQHGAERLVRCVKSLIPNHDTRMEYFVDIINGIREKGLSLDSTEHCLRICYFAVSSRETNSLTANMQQLFRV